MIEVMKSLQDVKAFFSTRQGGKSSGKYRSLNVGFHVGDDPHKVKQNHQIIKETFAPHADIAYMDQIHSDKVCQLQDINEIATCDSLLTDQKDKILMVMVADCIPLLFFDTKQKLVAAIHAGRKGTFLNIVAKTLESMSLGYGSKSEDIYVSIGPHIHECCYEVGMEIVNEALALGYEKAIETRDEHSYLNMQKIIMEQLLELGIKQEHIEVVDICTACNTQSFFSYRKEGQTGRFCGVIMLK
jgi:YfiH family protein